MTQMCPDEAESVADGFKNQPALIWASLGYLWQIPF